MLNEAIKYGQLGWKVFPVKGKKPAINGWQDQATSDPEKIPEIFNIPNTGIGLATGKISGITVVDVDNKNGVSGFHTLEIENIELNFTVCAQTPGGGHHYYFQYCDEIKNKVAALGDKSGVDIRNDGGVIILPPSIYSNGKVYQWKEGHAPWEIEIAPFPERLLKSIKEHDKKAFGQKSRFGLPESISNGQRNDTLFKFACSLSAMGKTEDEILSAVTKTNQERCDEPLADNEISTIVESACAYDMPNIHMKSNGKIKKSLPSIVGLFNSDQNLICLFYENLFDGCIHYSKTPVWNNEIKAGKRLDDTDLIFVKHYLAVNHRLEALTYLIGEAIIIVAHQNAIHPVRNYLNSLKWDGTERIKDWLTISCGVDQNAYTSCVGIKILVGAVARVYFPGIKFDHMLILEGPQGIGKSTFTQVLGGEWYAPVPLTDTDKDTVDSMLGAWIIENEEMACFTRQDIERLKAFISRSTDRVRLSYERRSKDFPRQSIFIGTMNPSGDNDYLRDPTGNRRFWPVVCTSKIDIQWLKENRDQLFAEAVVRFKANEKLYIDDPKVEEIVFTEQDKRRSRDPWTHKVYHYVRYRKDVSSGQIMYECLGIDLNKFTKSEQTRVGIIMADLGWEGKYSKKQKCSIYRNPSMPDQKFTDPESIDEEVTP